MRTNLKPQSSFPNHKLSGQAELVGLVRTQLAEAQNRNPLVSLRSFSKRLDITAAELSLILNGKRRLTRKMAQKILSSLSVEPQLAQSLLSALPERLPRKKRTDQSLMRSPQLPSLPVSPVLNYIQISTDEFRVIADWYYLAILSLSETDSFRSDVAWISRRLHIRKPEAQSAVNALVRLGLLDESLDSSGRKKWTPTGKRFTTTNDIPDASIRKNHSQGLELAQTALSEVPMELREFGASIIAADPDLLPEARERLRALRREIARILESGKKTEVYRLSIQLIPLTRPVSNPGELK